MASCSFLTLLPGLAWVLLNNICILFSRSLYLFSSRVRFVTLRSQSCWATWHHIFMRCLKKCVKGGANSPLGQCGRRRRRDHTNPGFFFAFSATMILPLESASCFKTTSPPWTSTPTCPPRNHGPPTLTTIQIFHALEKAEWAVR